MCFVKLLDKIALSLEIITSLKATKLAKHENFMNGKKKNSSFLAPSINKTVASGEKNQ